MIPNELPSTHPDNISGDSSGSHLKEKIQDSYRSGKESVSSCCETIRSESCQVCESVSDGIRKNPIAFVFGAAFLGAAVCYLILEGRSQPTFRDRYVARPLSDASDSVNESLRSIRNNLKFW